MNLLSPNKYHIFLVLLFSMLLFSTQKGNAQMFSVDEDEPAKRSSMAPKTGIYIGLEPIDFMYKGDENIQNAGAYDFDGPLMRLRFETLGFEAYMGVGGSLTGIDNIGYFDAGVKAVRGLRILRRPGVQVLLPLQIKSSINTVSNNQATIGDTQFRQGTLEFGGGGQLSVRLDNRIRLTVAAIPNYGFSFASGGIFGGQIFDLETKSRIYIDRIFNDLGLTAGWDYGFKRFDVEENEFDYNLRSFSFLLGITF